MTARVARVVVADDQAVVREGIVMLLGLLPGIEVVGSAKDGEEALALVAELAPDVVLMDLRMPRCDGVEATRRIRGEHPGTQTVVLTTYADDDSLFPVLRAGARGYLTKDAEGDEIVRAVQDVMAGRAGLSPAVQRRLLEQAPRRPNPQGRSCPTG
jgi:DNA-binding NarL/FixJ family response regulator